METRNHETSSPTNAMGNHRFSMNGEPHTPQPLDGGNLAAASAVKTGFALGHVIGVVADVVVGAVKGGIAAGKNGIGKEAINPFNPTAEHKTQHKEQDIRPHVIYGMTDGQDGRAFPIWVGESREP